MAIQPFTPVDAIQELNKRHSALNKAFDEQFANLLKKSREASDMAEEWRATVNGYTPKFMAQKQVERAKEPWITETVFKCHELAFYQQQAQQLLSQLQGSRSLSLPPELTDNFSFEIHLHHRDLNSMEALLKTIVAVFKKKLPLLVYWGTLRIDYLNKGQENYAIQNAAYWYGNKDPYKLSTPSLDVALLPSPRKPNPDDHKEPI